MICTVIWAATPCYLSRISEITEYNAIYERTTELSLPCDVSQVYTAVLGYLFVHHLLIVSKQLNQTS